MNNRLLRKTHRWLGLIVGLQLLAWTASGLYFSWFPINEVRGSHLRANQASNLDINQLRRTDLYKAFSQLPDDAAVESIQAGTRDSKAVWYLRYKLQDSNQLVVIDALSSKLLEPISEVVARRIAKSFYNGNDAIKAVNYLTEVELDSEYRGKELPAYQIQFDNSSDANFYIGATSGKLTAVRTDIWRGFDFLWMLHIMDYQERDNFNHVLLQILSFLAIITVLSGLGLWFSSSRFFKKYIH